MFAITQVTGYVSARPSWTRLIEGLAILAVVWFAWSGNAWLGNTAHTDDGLVRVILFAAMAAMLIASLAVPSTMAGSWSGGVQGGGSSQATSPSATAR